MANRFLVKSGNWSDPSIWSATEGGAGGAGVPTVTDNTALVMKNFVVTLDIDAEVNYLNMNGGRLNISSFNLFAVRNVTISSSTGGTLDMGSGKIEVGDPNSAAPLGKFIPYINGSLSIISGQSKLIINATSIPSGYGESVFNTLSATYNDVEVNLYGVTSSYTYPITGSPTFRSLSIHSKNSAAHTVNFDGEYITVGKLTATGSSSNRLLLKGRSGGSYLQFQDGGSSYGQYVNMQDITPVGLRLSAFPPAYIGSNSIQSGTSTGWLLQNPPKAITLIDEFTTSPLSPTVWSTKTAGSGAISVSGGKLNMSWTSGSSSYVELTSADTFDLVDSAFYFKVDSQVGGGIFATVTPLYGQDISMPIAPTSTPVWYRFRGVLAGNTVTIYGERGGVNGWTTLSTKSYEQQYARSIRVQVSGSRNLSSMAMQIDSFGVPPEPEADFAADKTSGDNPLAVQFTDRSNFNPTSWSWSFGDGTTSTVQNPSKTYALPGTYTVSLTSSKAGTTKTVTKTSYITVTPKLVTGGANGSIVLSGGISSSTAVAYGGAKGSIVLSGSLTGFVIQDVSKIEKKTYLYKVYDPDGNYIETWADVIDEPEFTEEINTLGSSMTIELARNSDSLGQIVSPLQTEAGQNLTTESGDVIYATTESRNQVGEGSSVNYNNRVDIYVFYGYTEPLFTESGEIIYTESGDPLLVSMGAPNGLRIFTGFISGVSSRYGDTESTVVQLSSYGWDLDQFPLMNGSSTTVSYLTQDPSNIAKDLADKFVAQSAGYGTYTHREEASISMTGTNVSYTFRANTYADGLAKIVELMPSNWYYRVGLGDNTIYFRERSASPKHLFLLGKHIKSLDLAGSILDSVNDVLFTGGGDPALYIRRTEAPAPFTRRRLSNTSDNRVTVLQSAEIIAENTIGNANKLLYRTTVTILTDVYDIETINIGDMVGFRNFDNYVDGLTMQVVGRSYTPDAVTLQLESMPVSVNKRLEDIRRNLAVTENQNVPNSPS